MTYQHLTCSNPSSVPAMGWRQSWSSSQTTSIDSWTKVGHAAVSIRSESNVWHSQLQPADLPPCLCGYSQDCPSMTYLIPPMNRSRGRCWERRCQWGIPYCAGQSSPFSYLTSYTCPLNQLVWSFELKCHQYADDTKLYLLMGNRLNTVSTNLAEGLVAVGWLKQNWLEVESQ